MFEQLKNLPKSAQNSSWYPLATLQIHYKRGLTSYKWAGIGKTIDQPCKILVQFLNNPELI